MSSSFPARRLGILAALPEEAAGLVAEMAADPRTRTERVGSRSFHVGTLFGRDCVLTLARVGKVAATTTTAALIHAFEVDAVLFTGVAGAISEDVHIGDVVVAETALQHDLDASPIFPRFEVPLTGMSRYPTDPALSERLRAAARDFLAGYAPPPGRLLRKPTLHSGLMISGDRFVSTGGEVARLRADLPDALAVEMEGAAVAQVCHDYGIACAMVRTVSDRADDNAHLDFPTFLRDIASPYADGILRRFLAG